ncbi:MAG: murein biosynthesis integral membrane protein MurJ [Planctomycetota bacterium]|nr:murein biosynthesis integral membrane protein MurJ [Planctomycetota bacterium]
MRTTSEDPVDRSIDSAARVDVVGRHTNLVRRTALVSLLTLASRIIGFAREMISASIFGDRSAISDAFVTAWRVPNLFRGLMGEGAITTAMQSEMTRVEHERGLDAGRRLFHATLRTVLLASIAVTIVGVALVLVVPDTMPITGWHWLGSDPGPVRELTARMLPFVVFVCGAAVVGGALQVRGHFLAPALAPVVMNACWIGALFVTANTYGWIGNAGETGSERFARHLDMARMLAAFVLGAGAVLFLVHVPPLARRGLFGARSGEVVAPRVRTRAVWSIMKSTLPLAFGAAVFQVNALISGFLAEALLANGGPTALYYAARLQQLPLSLVSVAATSAVFPTLAALGRVGDRVGLKRLHDDTHFAVLFVAVPATFGLFAFAGPVCAVCFGHGAFGVEGVERTSAALRWMTFAILPVGATGLVARAHYALGDYKTPVKIAVAMLVLNTALSVVFVAGLGMDADGLALATAISAWGNVILLTPYLRRALGSTDVSNASASTPKRASGVSRVSRIVVSALAAVGLAYALHRVLGFEANSASALALSIAIAVCAYAGITLSLGVPEAAHLVRRLRRA